MNFTVPFKKIHAQLPAEKGKTWLTWGLGKTIFRLSEAGSLFPIKLRDNNDMPCGVTYLKLDWRDKKYNT